MPSTPVPEPPAAADVETAVGDLLAAELASYPSIPGELVHVLSQSRDLDLSVARGVDDVRTGTPLSTDSTVRIASVTKTFTAAAILRLSEQQRLSLDDDLPTAGVPPELLDILRSGGYDPSRITVRQLLSHTSGIADYADNDTGVLDGPYAAAVLADPGHEWTAAEQVAFAVEHGSPASPGAHYRYSDTGYVLLGGIVEAKTAQPLGAALRGLVGYDALGLAATFLDDGEDRPAADLPAAHQYAADLDLAAISPSADNHGGGGIVTSMRDLAWFYDAVFEGRVFARSTTLTAMTTVGRGAAAERAALGIYQANLGPVSCWYHAGLYGVEALSCPDIDLTIARSWNQADSPAGFDSSRLLVGIADAVLASDSDGELPLQAP